MSNANTLTFIFVGHAGQRYDLRANPPRRVPDSQVHGQTPHVYDDPHTHPRAQRAAAGDVKGRSRYCAIAFAWLAEAKLTAAERW